VEVDAHLRVKVLQADRPGVTHRVADKMMGWVNLYGVVDN
jgi:hypothetical protein